MNISSNSGLTYGRGYTYKLQYHIVWCVKYRKNILTGDIGTFFKDEISSISKGLGFQIEAMECMPDHIHLLISCTPQHYIPTIVKILKGNTARHLFMYHPEIKSMLLDRHLWDPSYFVATVSDNTADQITEYISSQKVK